MSKSSSHFFFHNYVFSKKDIDRARISIWKYPTLWFNPTLVQIADGYTFYFKISSFGAYFLLKTERNSVMFTEVDPNEKEVEVVDAIQSICDAYEQGFGHGYQRRDLSNPYRKTSKEEAAWAYGYQTGKIKVERKEKNDYTRDGVSHTDYTKESLIHDRANNSKD